MPQFIAWLLFVVASAWVMHFPAPALQQSLGRHTAATVTSLTIPEARGFCEQAPHSSRGAGRDALPAAASAWVGVRPAAWAKAQSLRRWLLSHCSEIENAVEEQKALLHNARIVLVRWNQADRTLFGEWLGIPTVSARQRILAIVDRELALNARMTINNFRPARPSDPDVYAYVYSDDGKYIIYLDQMFWKASATGPSSRAGTLCHEMSHYDTVGRTDDLGYGTRFATLLARFGHGRALHNADNVEFYLESINLR